jgi:hypothetical protein
MTQHTTTACVFPLLHEHSWAGPMHPTATYRFIVTPPTHHMAASQSPATLTNQQPSAFWHGHALLCYKLLTGVSVTIRRVKFIGNRALCSRPSAQAPPASIPSTHGSIQQHQSARGALDSLIFHLVSGSSQPNHAIAPSSIFSIAVRCFAVTAQIVPINVVTSPEAVSQEM